MGMDNYYYPSGTPETKIAIQRVWNQLTDSSPGVPSIVVVAQGRTLKIEKQAKNVAQVEFSDMCETAKGSTDYMALAKSFNTVIIRNVPQLSMERRDILRRFILLIDQLYYHQVNVILEAGTNLEALFIKPKEQTQFDEEFAYERCLSRLKEMQTNEYQEKALINEHE